MDDHFFILHDAKLKKFCKAEKAEIYVFLQNLFSYLDRIFETHP